MDYFKSLTALLQLEKEEDRQSYRRLTENSSVTERRTYGLTWYPVAIRGTEMTRGDYLVVELERTTHQDLPHQLRTGVSVSFFSNHDPRQDHIEGIVTWQANDRLKINLRTEELPDWTRNGKLGVDFVFDDNSYDEMQQALKQAERQAEQKEEGRLIRILTGQEKPVFDKVTPFTDHRLNHSQQEAVQKILSAHDLAIVHGPPGTGKTTTLVQAIRALWQQEQKQLLVVAPSNTAVDLLSEKLAAAGMMVLRAGNPARVSERLRPLTMEDRMDAHSSMKEVRRLRKQASEYRNLAHKYKRSFGPAEREQRKALFAEARQVLAQAEQTEQYIIDDLVAKAQVITATPVGANHYTIRGLKYHTVVIDEAGQALEPACWIPVLKGQKLVLAGDHHQLSPTVKSEEAARQGLSHTLLEKNVALHPETVILLEEQYRMHAQIMGYSSNIFYEARLKAHASVAQHLLFDNDAPLLFIDTAGCGYEEKTEGTAISNPEEAAFLFRHLEMFMEELRAHYSSSFPSIGIISPYRRQLEYLQEQAIHTPALDPYRSYIAINTIDSFQGQERDIIYISLTRSNADSNIGFLSDIRRMNVAMTRARKKLVMIGDSATLARLPFYANLITYAEQHNAYHSAWEYMV